jgi:hypothetical protein
MEGSGSYIAPTQPPLLRQTIVHRLVKGFEKQPIRVERGERARFAGRLDHIKGTLESCQGAMVLATVQDHLEELSLTEVFFGCEFTEAPKRGSPSLEGTFNGGGGATAIPFIIGVPAFRKKAGHDFFDKRDIAAREHGG